MSVIGKVDLVGVGLNAIDIAHPSSRISRHRGSKTEYTRASIMPGGPDRDRRHRLPDLGPQHALYRQSRRRRCRPSAPERVCARTGVDARLITVPDAASPQSLIIVDEGGERTVLCRRDERLLLQPSDLDRELIVNSRALHVDGFETAAATQATAWAREAGIPVIADLDETYSGVDDLIANVDYLIVSRDFPSRLTGERRLEPALRMIKRRYGCHIAAATLGADGVLAWDGDKYHLNTAYRVPVVDTTGAGDIFHAGFIYSLLQDWPLDRQLDFACAAAALNCTCSGARGGIGRVDAIEQLMATTPRYAVAAAD